MITKVFFLSTFALAVQSFPQNVQLLSKVPSEPIEDPNSWAWGRHPKNGYGYKARNTLTVDQCLKNRHLVDTPQCSFPAQLCIDNPEFIPLKACDGKGPYPAEVCTLSLQIALLEGCKDADFPKDFCVSNAAKMIKVNGCKPYLIDLCTTDVSLAVSDDCADAEFPKDFCVSNAVKMIKVKGCASYKTDLCTADISLALSSDCAGVKLPKKFCVSDLSLVKAAGCSKFLGDICSQDLDLANSATCLPAQKKVSYFKCTRSRDICFSQLCELKVKDKGSCPQ